MDALAEHLLDPTLAVVSAPGFQPLALHVQHQRSAVNVAAAVFCAPAGEAPIVLVNGMLRPAQFAALVEDVNAFNADPADGWRSLARTAAANLRAEIADLDRRIGVLDASALLLTGFARG